MAIAVFLAWSIFIWAHANTFGSTPECNAKIKYVVLFYPVRATASWLRKFWIIGLGISAGWMVIGIIAAFFVIRWARREGIDEDDLNLGDYFPKASRLLSFTLLWCVPFSLALACRKVEHASCIRVAVLSIVMLELLVRPPPGRLGVP